MYYELSQARRRPFVIAMPATQAWRSKLARTTRTAACRAPMGAAESLFSIFGPIVMTQVFGAFEHKLPGAPFFVAAVLSVVALLIAMRAMRAAPAS